jgi:hypothetical protein
MLHRDRGPSAGALQRAAIIAPAVNPTEHAIRLRNPNPVSVSQANDFVLETGRTVNRSRIFDPDISPYCFDFEQRSLYCVSTPSIAGATFFYQAQRQSARSVIKVPFDSLPEASRSPTLIFSIGRCGSTLLHKAFESAGARSVSEPDYFTQAALSGRDNPELRAAIGRATQLLPYSLIKLRAECSNAALLIAGAFPEPKVIFLLRDPTDWAISVRRVSHNPTPGGIAALLRTLLAGLDNLTRHYDVRICHYEDLRRLSPEYVNALLAWTGSDCQIASAVAAELSRRDAQAGSTVSRLSVKDTTDDPAFLEAFRHEWARLRPVALIKKLDLARL